MRLDSIGFELQSLVTDMEIGYIAAGSPEINIGSPISGSASLRVFAPNTGLCQKKIRESSTAKVYFSMRVRVNVLNPVNSAILQFAGGTGVYGFKLRLINDKFRITNDNGSVFVDSPVIMVNQTYLLEVSYDDAHVDNLVTAKLNGVAFATDMISTNCDGAYNVIYGMSTSHATLGDVYFDDLKINDESGSFENSWPSQGKLVHLYPDANGDTQMGARGGSDSGSNFGQVDEFPTPNDNTNYWRLNENNDIFEVNVEPSLIVGIAADDTIHMVAVGARTRAVSASQESWVLRIKSQAAGTVLEGAERGENDTTWRTHGKAIIASGLPAYGHGLLSFVNPQNGNPWTPAALDSSQIGIRAIDANPDIFITSLWELVEFSPSQGSASPVKASGVAATSAISAKGKEPRTATLVSGTASTSANARALQRSQPAIAASSASATMIIAKPREPRVAIAAQGTAVALNLAGRVKAKVAPQIAAGIATPSLLVPRNAATTLPVIAAGSASAISLQARVIARVAITPTQGSTAAIQLSAKAKAPRSTIISAGSSPPMVIQAAAKEKRAVSAATGATTIIQPQARVLSKTTAIPAAGAATTESPQTNSTQVFAVPATGRATCRNLRPKGPDSEWTLDYWDSGRRKGKGRKPLREPALR